MPRRKHPLRTGFQRLQTTLKREWLIVLDLDRTLFDTARFYQDFLAALAHTWNTELATTMMNVERTGEHLDPFEYLQDKHGITYEEVINAFKSFTEAKYPNGTNYLFEGAPELVEYLRKRPCTQVLIMTTGTKQSQEFKIALCPELASLNHEIISENKGKVLQDKFEETGSITLRGRHFHHFVLVDDKASALMPIAAHKRRILIHILREDAKFQEHTGRSDIREVSALRQVIDLLR